MQLHAIMETNMEQQSDLFVPASCDEGKPAMSRKVITGDACSSGPVRDRQLFAMLVRYVRSFESAPDEIEAKGRLIDFIRNV